MLKKKGNQSSLFILNVNWISLNFVGNGRYRVTEFFSACTRPLGSYKNGLRSVANVYVECQQQERKTKTTFDYLIFIYI